MDVTCPPWGTRFLLAAIALTPPESEDGNVYAMSPRPLTRADFAGCDAATASKNRHGGAQFLVVRSLNGVSVYLQRSAECVHQSAHRGFSSTKKVADAVNRAMGGQFARPQCWANRVAERAAALSSESFRSWPHLRIWKHPDSKARSWWTKDRNSGSRLQCHVIKLRFSR